MNRYSIILPVYNGGEYFKECVFSILSQTYACFDLHVLDNHSTDGSSEWIKTKTIKDWQDQKPDIHKKPAIFLLMAE